MQKVSCDTYAHCYVAKELKKQRLRRLLHLDYSFLMKCSYRGGVACDVLLIRAYEGVRKVEQEWEERWEVAVQHGANHDDE